MNGSMRRISGDFVLSSFFGSSSISANSIAVPNRKWRESNKQAKQEAFFSRWQHDGETLKEFSLALLSLMSAVKQSAPSEIPDADVLLRDQFIENLVDGFLRWELKQLVHRRPTISLRDARVEAIRWEQEDATDHSRSVPLMTGLQSGAQTASSVANPPQVSELQEVKQMLKLLQEQLNHLSETLVQLQANQQRGQHLGPVICCRCQHPGHFAAECKTRFPPDQQHLLLHGPPLGMNHLKSTQNGDEHFA